MLFGKDETSSSESDVENKEEEQEEVDLTLLPQRKSTTFN